MRISDTEPSSVILSQTKEFKKFKSDAPKIPKQADEQHFHEGILDDTGVGPIFCYNLRLLLLLITRLFGQWIE